MANHKSSKKRIIRNEKKRVQNKNFISKVKTFVKKVELLLKAGKKEEAVSQAKSAESILAKAASKGRIHKNKAARKTSRMYKSLKK